MALAAMACSPLSGRIVGSRGPRLPLLTAGGVHDRERLMLTQLTPGTSLALLFVSYAIFGAGFGAVNSPITYTAVSGMPDNQAGVAAAVASTSRAGRADPRGGGDGFDPRHRGTAATSARGWPPRATRRGG